jgi:hypothetical protein
VVDLIVRSLGWSSLSISGKRQGRQDGQREKMGLPIDAHNLYTSAEDLIVVLKDGRLTSRTGIAQRPR